MFLAVFEPDIPQNTAAMIRLAACLGVPIELIGPFGFVMTDQRLRRVGMDYLDVARITRHESWRAFQAARPPGSRLVLLTTRGATPHIDFAFRPDDILMVGRESSGVPQEVHEAADARVRVPLAPPARSLNVAIAAAIVLAEALRQTGQYPKEAS